MCYLTLMPLLLWPMSGWASPFLSVVIAFLLLGVENIGAYIEEPFHVMALDTFCATVQRDIRNILAMHSSSGIAGSSVDNVPVVGGLNSPGQIGLRSSSEQQQLPLQQQQHCAIDFSSHSRCSNTRCSHSSNKRLSGDRCIGTVGLGSRTWDAGAAQRGSMQGPHCSNKPAAAVASAREYSCGKQTQQRVQYAMPQSAAVGAEGHTYGRCSACGGDLLHQGLEQQSIEISSRSRPPYEAVVSNTVGGITGGSLVTDNSRACLLSKAEQVELLQQQQPTHQHWQ
eukprot:GHUV01025758.1.p1 GENE.GHUV01025758.1~~GHUV01025758.1.p1  ORF type:complete len:283 (+),score=73.60 GHUV01025758.1:121-969(+)